MWQRARTDEQRAERVRSILDAAARLFESKSYESVTLKDVAEEAGFTRSNLYRYFRTREEIFLEIYRWDLEAWENEVESTLAAAGPIDLYAELPRFVGLWTDVLAGQARLLRLSPLLAVSLERNSSRELYRGFKEFTRHLMDRAAEMLSTHAPGLDEEQLQRFFLFHHALVAGAAPMARYTEMQLDVLSTPGLAPLRVEFSGFYARALSCYLQGALGG